MKTQYYDIFTTHTIKWQYIYSLPPIFNDNAFQIRRISKWSWNIDFEIIRQFYWDIIKLLDTPKKKFKIKLFVVKTT